LREVQSSYGDVLVILGGGPGTQHLADLYGASGKPVIPLDLDLNKDPASSRVSEILAVDAMETPSRFFQSAGKSLTALYSTMSLRGKLIPPTEFSKRFWTFFGALPRPLCFFVKLQNKSHEEFDNTDRFFKSVVIRAVSGLGFQKFETGVDTTAESFLNIEIFNQIARSRLVVVDVTGLRPNCFMEMGYAYGSGKRVILTAKTGTRLPFDSASLPCFFWAPDENTSLLGAEFAKFVRRNMDRGPLIGGQAIQTKVHHQS
jgi:hypothetical protein